MFVAHFCPTGSRDPIEFGSNPDPDAGLHPDPQHWFKGTVRPG
jgi:hypothetical protein